MKPFKTSLLLAGCAALAIATLPGTALAGSKVTIGGGLSDPWVLQFKPKKRMATREALARVRAARQRSAGRPTAPTTTGSVQRQQRQRQRQTISPSNRRELMPQTVEYFTNDKPGTIVVNTIERRLYLILPGGKARRYGIGVGKPGFEWSGTHKVTRKAEWPDWRPPAEMIVRERKKGRELPPFMAGGPENPLGARALYLGSTIYRIHGTNQDWSIGQAVSSGCIRMRNQDVMDLYDRVPRGTKVRVI